MQKIDSRRLMREEAARGLVCPYLTKTDYEKYCCASTCMAWRWEKDSDKGWCSYGER